MFYLNSNKNLIASAYDMAKKNVYRFVNQSYTFKSIKMGIACFSAIVTGVYSFQFNFLNVFSFKFSFI